MAKVLFTHSYFYQFDPKQWRMKQPYPPLATILAASVVRKAGFSVALFDTNLKSDTREITPLLQREAPDYLVIYDDSFNYLSKMCLTTMREAAFAMAREGKQNGCVVIASSSDAADHYEKYFQHDVDYVIKGEGEETLLDLLTALHHGKDTSLIPGIVYKKEDDIIINPSRPVMKDLDVLPLPAWDLVDILSYEKIWRSHHGYFSLNIATTRGCPFKCNWCAKPIYGNRYTSRSPQHVVQEIEYLLHHYQPDHFWMCDDIFGLKPGWIQAFRDLVTAKGLSFGYTIQSRADLLLQEDTIDALARSGARTVWIGAESGSQKILDAMDKGTTLQQISEATKLLKQNNIRTAFFLQFGYLGETDGDIDRTIQMVKDLMPDEVGISVSYPLPGTKFYEKVKSQMKEKQNWADSDDLAMMFEGTFNRGYYRKLHRYVHSVYRKQRGIQVLQKLVKNPLKLTYRDVRTGLASFYFAAQAYTLNKKLSKLKVTNA